MFYIYNIIDNVLYIYIYNILRAFIWNIKKLTQSIIYNSKLFIAFLNDGVFNKHIN